MVAKKIYALAVAGLLAGFGICSSAQSKPAPPASTPPAASNAAADNLNQAASNATTAATTLSKAATDAASTMGIAANNAATTLVTATSALNAAADKTQGAVTNANSAVYQANKVSDQLAAQLKALQNALAKTNDSTVHAAKKPVGDYVPCLFDSSQDKDLRALPYKDQKTALSSDELDAIIAGISAALAPPAQNEGSGEKSDTPEAVFTKNLTDLKNTLQNLPQDKIVAVVQQLALGLSTAEQKQLNTYLQAVLPSPTYDRPPDVSCSFSILQWKETKDVFGRRVANDYVALEVNLRNLNTQNEFLVHDIQIAVDTGLTSWEFGRFEASRDKQIVRGVVQRGQSEDRRNLIINTLTAAGAILSPIGAFVSDPSGGGIGTGISIFQGPFLIGANNLFPDHTLEYLNNLNDLGFSPSSTNKTVVPVQGSVPLVTFLAEKPLEQLPFVRCGQSHYMMHRNNDLKSEDDLNHPNERNCQLHPPYVVSTGGKNYVEDSTFDDTLTGEFRKPLAFKSWDGAALNILGHRVFVVIAGVHIQQVSDEPSVSNLTCPLNADQKSVDITTNPTVTCTVSGGNLDQAAPAIKLEQGATTIAGTLTAYASGNTGTISFKASDVIAAKASGSYELFLTTTGNTGKDIDSKWGVTFILCNAAPPAPAPPAQGATAPTSTVINLSWSAVTAPANCTISSYKVYGSRIAGYTPSASNQLTCPVGLTCSNTGLSPSTAYHYIVEAVDEAGASPPSSPGTISTTPQ